ncbi:MAG: sigma-70 family RNA polymerase sigma factor [Candidatus Gastranaerophilales bacterium]|nr:sigma-70 family RNA polymerase sigma factor [Candidatus Gastranaerophilales bacterium]
MHSKQSTNLKKYKDLIETIAKVEYRKLCAAHLIEYPEMYNIAAHTVYDLIKMDDDKQFNNSYLATAIKWAIRNEIRRRYRWYSQRKSSEIEDQEDLREAVYKTILSIDEIMTLETPTFIKDERKNPEESLEFSELKQEIIEAIKKLPQKEKELIESRFFKDRKLKEISVEFDLSPSRVSRLIQSGLNKIKKDLKRQNVCF